MAVPFRRTSKSVKRKRRTHFKVTLPGMAKCSNCNEVIKPHQMCPNCGYYKGKQVKEINKDK